MGVAFVEESSFRVGGVEVGFFVADFPDGEDVGNFFTALEAFGHGFISRLYGGL